ncbi:DUF1963 domain-containing protein [Magnetococcus sp. PR-3]|uniref:DUF1963 domain-containing protein n=1 Tax=Magnetococcus sp. PR-3 TaxID=3120355 RepID=UPI002FCE5B13
MSGHDEIEWFFPAIVLLPQLGAQAECCHSHFGGYPRLPASMPWPVDTQGQAMHFMAQITCSELPRTIAYQGGHIPIEQLPERGTIFVFISAATDDLWENSVGYHHVCYTEEDVSTHPLRYPPSNIPVLGEESLLGESYSLFHYYCDYDQPRIPQMHRFPRTPFVGQAYVSRHTINQQVRDLLHADDQGDGPARQQALAKVAHSHALESFMPNVEDEGLYLTSLYAPWMVYAAQYKKEQAATRLTPTPPIPLPESFPWMWGVAGVLAQQIWRDFVRVLPNCNSRYFSKGELTVGWPYCLAYNHLEKARDWMNQTIEHGLFTAMDAHQAQAFRDWLTEMDALKKDLPENVFDLSGAQQQKLMHQLIPPKPCKTKGARFRRALRRVLFGEERRFIMGDHFNCSSAEVAFNGLAYELQSLFLYIWPYLAEDFEKYGVPKQFVNRLAPLFAADANGGGLQQMLGVPYDVQPSSRKADEVLLLQLDSSRSLGLMIGDVGNLHLFIRATDLKNRNFTRTRLEMASH